MKKAVVVRFIIIGMCIITSETERLFGQENAAPSMHLTHNFSSSDAILKMQKVKVVQSAYASYFEVNWFTNGYAGLQQTPSNSYGSSNILISSLWDINTAGGIYSKVEFNDSTTFTSRFGGEGDGWKSINPYKWSVGIWYNIVQRAWVSDDRLFIATFINNLYTNKWFHTATLSIPFTGVFLSNNNDAFIENWDGTNTQWNGAFVRKAFFKDSWKINIKDGWEKNTDAYFSANNSSGDIKRNGIYHNSFNAGYDKNENAYFMQHGGNTTPSSDFNGGRTLKLPAQIDQGLIPVLTIGDIKSVAASRNNDNKTRISWIIDEAKSPQLSARLKITESFNNNVIIFQDTLPQRRSYDLILGPGEYHAVLSVIDIFNHESMPYSIDFSVPGTFLTVSTDTLTISSAAQSTKTFNIASNTNWEISSNQPWLSVNNKNGSGNASITLTAQSNPDTLLRMATVTISYTNNAKKFLTVIQNKSSVTGFIQIKDDQKFSIYPNPSRNLLFFENAADEKEINIYDGTGRVVLSGQIHNKQFDISNLSTGVYIIHVLTDNQIVTMKFMKD